jgi:hypothetical protein
VNSQGAGVGQVSELLEGEVVRGTGFEPVAPTMSR